MVPSIPHPHAHFRVMPPTSITIIRYWQMIVHITINFEIGPASVGPSGIVPQLPYPALQTLIHPSSRNTVAKYTSQISADSSASDSSASHPSIQHLASGNDNPEERVYIRESIISLLLKLHSRFSGHDDSYRSPPDIVAGRDAETEDCRIGDGSFWIAKVLDKLCRLDPRVKQSIASVIF